MENDRYRYPLLVRGNWGDTIPKGLKNKLVCYFQSAKKSGGGDCQIAELRPQHALICFAGEEVRQKVLNKSIHELPLPNCTLKLEVKLPDEPKEDVVPENVASATIDQKNTDTQEVLKRESHTLKNPSLHSRSLSEECINTSLHSRFLSEECINRPQITLPLSVLLENIQEKYTQEMLTMLVENISNLEDDHFQTELIPEIHAAVVTFMNHDDAAGFLVRCPLNSRIRQQNITAGPLELTKCIRVENLPPEANEEYLAFYFESHKSGGGPVLDVKMLPDENSAVITFVDPEAVSTVLSRIHTLMKTTMSVYPYYSSLGTALYGKERPVVKMPDPISLDMDPHVWQYIQKNKKRIQEINKRMAECYCELKWPEPNCAHAVIQLCPSRLLSEQKSNMAKLVKTWCDQVGTQFSTIMSMYTATECKVNSAVWKAVREKVKSALSDEILMIPDIANGKVVLTGFLGDVEGMKRKVTEMIEDATRKFEQESKSKKMMISCGRATYAVLCNDNLEESLHAFFPDLKISYSAPARKICLDGLPPEVFSAKSEILEKERNLLRKTVDLDSHVVQFLQEIDDEEFSCSLFTHNKIYAIYKILEEKVVLMGNSHDVLLTAEKKLKESVICKLINTEDSTAIQKKEWKDLTSHMIKSFNHTTTTVVIDDYSLRSVNQIVIVGCCEAVNKVYQQAYDFIEKNTIIQKIIRAKSLAVVLYMRDEKAQLWTGSERKGVKTVFNVQNGQKHITLRGPRADVLEINRKVQMALACLHAHRLHIDKPGAKKFFQSVEDVYVPAAKKKFNCLIRLQKDGEEFGDDDDDDEDEGMNQGQPYCKVQLRGGVVVAIYKGDLSQHQVDVIVNASNEDLKHIGGLAAALLQAAGPKLQKDCDHIVKEHGQFKPGEAVITEAGRLACKQVIHAVGPRWTDFSPAQCECLLNRVVKESLRLAELYNNRSIAIPAVSSGIFGFPLKFCVETIIQSIKEYMEDVRWEGVLQQIHLVDTADKTVEAFKDALEKVFKHQVMLDIVSEKPEPKPRRIAAGRDYAQSSKCLQRIQTKEGLCIILDQGSIQDAETDVIVNSISTDLKLDKGAVSQALLQKAGPKLQELLEKQGRGLKITEGFVLRTDGCNLNCKEVFHVTSPGWDKGKGTSEKVLGNIIKECLNTAKQWRFRSITFPAIGTGNLGFPRPTVATITFDQIFKFSHKKEFRNLKEVHILLHPSDTESIKAFSSELEKRSSGKIPAQSPSSDITASAQGPPFFGAISQPTLGVYEMQIGTITFQVKTGDITKEKADVIVNSSNDKFNLKSGVSKAILEAAGQIVETECARLAQQANSGYIVTQNGNLQCQKIIHIAGRTAPADIKICVQSVLQECEQLTASSVAFPAIGTGQGNAAPSLVADTMIDAVTDFANQNTPQFVKTIKIIIFQPQMVNSFYTSMKQKESTDLPEPQTFLGKVLSFFTGVKSKPEKTTTFVLKDNCEPAIFQICGESSKAVEDTASWIRDLILKEQQEHIIRDEWITEFEEEEHKKLDELQKELQIAVEMRCTPSESFIRVSGLTRDVLKACNEIQDMIKKGKDEHYKNREADIISNLVEWQYSDTGNKWVVFDNLNNLKLEEGKSDKGQTTTVNLNKEKYVVDFEREYAKNSTGTKIKIKRVSKTEGAQSMEIPQQWDPMNNITEVKEVPLRVGSAEYTTVATLFQASCKNQILKIERIQNQTLWRTYQIKKQNMDAKNGHTNNEKKLFHGTAFDTLKAINKYGFNRSYAGMHAAVYGNGTYFAVQAQYSASNAYSKPDANGQKYMYLARVLSGDFCVGRSGIVTPPSKSSSDPTNLFDSVTDNTANPSMFVIFNDNQAYPEYLITLR